MAAAQKTSLLVAHGLSIRPGSLTLFGCAVRAAVAMLLVAVLMEADRPDGFFPPRFRAEPALLVAHKLQLAQRGCQRQPLEAADSSGCGPQSVS